jgi:hypothetical protein
MVVPEEVVFVLERWKEIALLLTVNIFTVFHENFIAKYLFFDTKHL